MPPAGGRASSSTQLPISPIRPLSSASGMKRAGRDHAESGVRPADERLHPFDGPVGDADDRLVDEVELAAARRPRRRSCSSSTRSRHLGPHRFVEDGHRVSARLLRLVHGGVGVTDEHLGAGAGIVTGARRRGRCWPRRRTPSRSIDERGARGRSGAGWRRSSACDTLTTWPRTTMNSSPPMRVTRSAGRTCAFSRSATAMSSSSPWVWPSVSLTSLKRSRSRNSSARGCRPPPPVPARSSGAGASSAGWASPVRLSCMAW